MCVCVCFACLAVVYVTYNTLLNLLLTECECECVCVWLWGADRGGCSSSGCGLVAGWCVCVVLGWWVRSPSRLLLLSHKVMRALRAAGGRPRKFWLIFAVKHNEKAIDNKLYIRYIQLYLYPISYLYPTISDYISSYPITHHIPPYLYSTISHHILTYQNWDIPKIYARGGLIYIIYIYIYMCTYVYI